MLAVGFVKESVLQLRGGCDAQRAAFQSLPLLREWKDKHEADFAVGTVNER